MPSAPKRAPRYAATLDHRFTEGEQQAYDALEARGRTLYDELRWFKGYDHAVAFVKAREAFGLKKAPASLLYCPTCREHFAGASNPPYSVVHAHGARDEAATHYHPVTRERLG